MYRHRIYCSLTVARAAQEFEAKQLEPKGQPFVVAEHVRLYDLGTGGLFPEPQRYYRNSN
jgi:hypothetical protein